MAKKQAKLSVVAKSSEQDLAKRQAREDEQSRWDEEEKKMRPSKLEMRRRVNALREELEHYRAQLEAVPFDLPEDGIPRCLDYNERRYTVYLCEELNPRIPGLFKLIDELADKHGCRESIDFNAKLFTLKEDTVETGFKLGVLAGVIFAGCSKETVDRFTRGLAFSMCQGDWRTHD